MRHLLVVAGALVVSGCASMFGGTSQDIEVGTSPEGADCALIREGKVVGRVNPTPGAVMIKKSRHDVSVSCKKDGFQEAISSSKSGIEGWVFANILFGGLIGLGIDHATGAVNKYETPIMVNMPPSVAGRDTSQPPQDPVNETVSPSTAQAPTS